MQTALVIIGLSMVIFLVVFYLKRAKEKRKAREEEERITDLKYQTEKEKIKAYGESINEETRNKK
jgi:multisubunit Na+/H+ antiporter MnhB subunit